MFKLQLKMLVGMMAALWLMLLLTACGSVQDQLLGKWEGDFGPAKAGLEFFKDGTIITSGVPVTGKYSWLDDNRIKMEWLGVPLVFNVAFKDDVLTITGNGVNLNLKRVKA